MSEVKKMTTPEIVFWSLFFVGMVLLMIYLVLNSEIKDMNENKIETKCFQRILGIDRMFDIGTNTILSEIHYNLTWHETECGEYDDYEVRKPSDSSPGDKE